jgi:hypothetical protein
METEIGNFQISILEKRLLKNWNLSRKCLSDKIVVAHKRKASKLYHDKSNNDNSNRKRVYS